jgi:hypothetical protein
MVTIAIYYNGKFPRVHQVSQEFYDRLTAWLRTKPHFDCVVEVVG